MNTFFRHSLAFAFGASLSLSAITFCSLKPPAPEEIILGTLGMSEENVHNRMMHALRSERLRIPSIAQLKSVATGDRAAIALSCFEYLKDYSRSAEFRERYSSYREEHKPAPEIAVMDAATLNSQTDAMRQAITQYEDLAKSLGGAQRKEIEKAIVAYKAELEKVEHPERSEAMQRWAKEYPASPDGKIKIVLKEFLDKTAGVDFNATLHKKPEIGKMVFDNPAYESKSDEWKMCYRAGREATDAVRKYAAQWLAELK